MLPELNEDERDRVTCIKEIRTFIPGKAIPKLRPRLDRRGVVRTPDRLKAWKSIVAWHWATEWGIVLEGDAIRLGLEFVLANRRSLPDVDNLAGGVMDGLNGIDVRLTRGVTLAERGRLERGTVVEGLGRAWRDDRHVSTLYVRRRISRGAPDLIGVALHIQALRFDQGEAQ